MDGIRVKRVKIPIQARCYAIIAVEKSESLMFSSESTDWVKDERMQSCQNAVEYGIDMCQLDYLLTLTPAERLRRHDAALAFVLTARKAGIKHYGFDPRSSETSQ